MILLTDTVLFLLPAACTHAHGYFWDTRTCYMYCTKIQPTLTNFIGFTYHSSCNLKRNLRTKYYQVNLCALFENQCGLCLVIWSLIVYLVFEKLPFSQSTELYIKPGQSKLRLKLFRYFFIMDSVFNSGFSSYSLNALYSFHGNVLKSTVLAVAKSKGQMVKKFKQYQPSLNE